MPLAKISLFALFLFFFLLLTACSTAPKKPLHIEPGDYSHVIEYAKWLIKKEIRKRDLVGLSIAIVDDQELVWSSGFGFASVEDGIKATGDTLYRAGSLSKLLTATAIMRLHEEGRLDIDNSVQTYIPSLKLRSRFTDDNPFTLRQVLSHHSGLPSEYLKGMWSDNAIDFRDLPALIGGEYLASPPDTILSYSNLGVSLLGITIENTSDSRYEDYIDEIIFDPLEMESSYIGKSVVPSVLMSEGYRKGKRAAIVDLSLYPAGGLVSSVNDLSQFLKMIFARGANDNKRVLKANTIEEMITRQNAHVKLDFDKKIGLGWFLGPKLKKQKFVNRIMHSGTTLLFNSKLTADPNNKVGVIVMSNSDRSIQSVEHIANKVLNKTIKAKLGHSPRYTRAHSSSGSQSLKPLVPGYYVTQLGLVKVKSIRDDQYVAYLNGTKFSLEKNEQGQYGVKLKLLGVVPLPIPGIGNLTLAAHKINQNDVLSFYRYGNYYFAGERIYPSKISDKWRSRIGRYEIDNLGEDDRFIENLEITEQEGFLMVTYEMTKFTKMKVQLVLNLISESAAVIHGKGRYLGETVHARQNNNGQDILYWAGYEMKRTE
ncbi:MAG: beta-lactamase family protein [Pseudomonadales bacterium]|nr:beta-lactamase family protein [Pseudomonadales bacterium]